ncbi:hypothetical protein AB0J80_13340 [Actinoplanes sp. NPDC049548]|uniref:hypothetical protein n=1 Tax=Actinoplanes sp. NPDC049548 TaxID=3155152 RepID=UPI003422D479
MAWEWLGPVATGVVGVVGVLGTTLTAALGRRTQLDLARVQAAAENRRALMLDKRSLYAKLLHQAETNFNLALRESAIRGLAAEAEDAYSKRLVEVADEGMREATALQRLRLEVGIVGGIEIEDHTASFALRIQQLAGATSEVERGRLIDEASDLLSALTRALHADLEAHRRDA